MEESLRLYDYRASGNCYKVRLLLALLGRDYERVPVDIFAGETLTDEYARINAARETPVLELDDGTLIPQSGAILWYLGMGTSYLPPRPAEQAQVVRWLLFEQEWVMSGIGATRFWTLTGRGGDQLETRRAHGRRALELLERHLESSSHLVGGVCTVADIANFAYTHRAGDAGYDLDDYPAVSAWLARIRSEPGYVNDLVLYPDNARPGHGRSIYDG
jgi:glutathione S-transferase